MKNFCHCQIIGMLGSSKTYAEEELPSASPSDCEPADSIKSGKHSSTNWMKKFRKESDSLSHGKVIMGTRNVSETIKRMLSQSKRIFQAARVERFLRKSFDLCTEERLQEVYQCSLFTTVGPISGRLFITSERLAFHSNKSLKVKTSIVEVAKFPYKVSIPLRKVKKTIPSDNLNKPEEKFVQIVTIDDFEFWFTGFVTYKSSFVSLFSTISQQQ
ncbi:GRAM domain-containing protein / ABA-responsive [Rhynchospora pubera]|uniref:GRAM domain-containing protein / ABA-responsive n=1 Tax=Rhynchospora pubera TaxID=906938 RepID=A0AAV8H7B5_9POAL|nr:GRAM domain-containing protein / ABA-responsive [Rhynchospora pubera]